MPIIVRTDRDVPSAIGKAIARSRIHNVMLDCAKRRIDNGGDSQIKYPPIKSLAGLAMQFWQAENQRRYKLLFNARGLARKFGRATSGKVIDPLTGQKLKAMPPPGESFRYGGKPLLDTRNTIYNALSARRQTKQGSVEFAVHSGGPNPLVAVYHQNGFQTHGPNFIPLSIKARRTHVTGADPRREGLVPGVDYVMVWKGVKVPPRPIVRFPPEDVEDVVDALRVAFR